MSSVVWVPSRRTDLSFEDRALLRLLGEQIQGARERHGMTQEDLVERADLDRSHLAKIEAGTVNPSVLTLNRIARGLGTTLARLFES